MREFYPWLLKQKWAPSKAKVAQRPRLVFIIGMARTGSTLAKRYLGQHDELLIAPLMEFKKSIAAARNRSDNKIVIDKATKNIDLLPQIQQCAGADAWFLGLVRDPRAELYSLMETERHGDIPRDATFWPYWTLRYSRLFNALKVLNGTTVKTAIVRYEDLATRPMDTKRNFCQWLDIDDRIDGTSYDVHQSFVKGDDKTEDWKAHENTHVHNKSLSRWKSAQGTQRSIILEYQNYRPAQSWMKAFGYPTDDTEFMDVPPKTRDSIVFF